MALGGRLAVDVEELRQALTLLKAAKRGGGCVKLSFRAGDLEISRGVSAARASATGSWIGTTEVSLKPLAGCVDVASREGASNMRFEARGQDLVLTFGLPTEGGRSSSLSIHAQWSE
jgi:hypothetical protein